MSARGSHAGRQAAMVPPNSERLRRSPISSTIFIGNLSFEATEDELRTLLVEVDPRVRVRLGMDRVTGRSRGFAFARVLRRRHGGGRHPPLRQPRASRAPAARERRRRQAAGARAASGSARRRSAELPARPDSRATSARTSAVQAPGVPEERRQPARPAGEEAQPALARTHRRTRRVSRRAAGRADAAILGLGLGGDGPDPEQHARPSRGPRRRASALDALEPSARRGSTELSLPAPRSSPPAALAALCSHRTRRPRRHTYGKSFRDVVRGLRGDFPNPPDVVAYPAHRGRRRRRCSTGAAASRAAVIPYGGGSSVVGGVEPPPRDRHPGVVSLDLDRPRSRARGRSHLARRAHPGRRARSRARGAAPAARPDAAPLPAVVRVLDARRLDRDALGRALRDALHAHRRLRRGAARGHAGAASSQTRRLPGSGAGPSPDRLFIGSEGILGVITEAWMRLQDRPTFRASASVTFADFAAGAEAARAHRAGGPLSRQLPPARPGRGRCSSGAGSGRRGRPARSPSSRPTIRSTRGWRARSSARATTAAACRPDAGRTRTRRRGRARGRRRRVAARLPRRALPARRARRARHGERDVRDRDHLGPLPGVPRRRDRAATQRRRPARLRRAGSVTCRFTHVYPDGPAPYYTVIAPGRRGAELEQWAEIKAAAADAILRHGGTITHHHAVGRDHRPWYDRERPDALRRRARAPRSARSIPPGSSTPAC